MDQYLNNRQNKILWTLLANPADNGHLYTYNLQRLVKDFPQGGLLHALLSRSDSEQNISHAAAYFNPKALYAMINTSESLAAVDDERIIQELSATANYAIDDEIESQQETEPEQQFKVEPEAGPDEENSEPVVVVADDEKVEVEAIGDIVEAEENLTEAPPVIEQEVSTEPEAVGETDQPIESKVEEAEAVVEETAVPELAEPRKDIDDDVYDEIVGIEDISFVRSVKPGAEAIFHEEPAFAGEDEIIEEVSDNAKTETTGKDRALNLDDEAEKLILGNIAATDYFVFDRAVGERKQAEIPGNDSPVSTNGVMSEHTDEQVTSAETKEVSKYYDEKMPYTFMWWLDKTRKEHAGIYQPFKLDTSQMIRHSAAEELQQQYYENIFHLSAVEELDRSTSAQTVEFDLKNKEDRIIKRFIVEEPHISPPSSDKLDTENKAKKSAEDQDELVTETLARIYIDQMLYHKAINTYKKLMLKFPEKSRYFADQIEQLERKTN